MQARRRRKRSFTEVFKGYFAKLLANSFEARIWRRISGSDIFSSRSGIYYY
jgi:hypothetical protein